MGVMVCQAQVAAAVDPIGIQGLQVVLPIVVNLVFVAVIVVGSAAFEEVGRISRAVVDDACIVLVMDAQQAVVAFHEGFRCSPPALVGTFATAEVDQAERLPGIPVTQAGVKALQVRCSAVDIAIALDGGKTKFCIPMIVDEPGTALEGGSAGAEGAEALVEFCIGLVSGAFGYHVQCSSKCTGTIGAVSHAPLQLDALQAGCQVWRVHPEYPMAFGIVQGHTVERHIDTCGVAAAHADAGVADAGAGIAGTYDAWLEVEQDRDVLPQVLCTEFFFVHLGIGSRAAAFRTRGRNDNSFGADSGGFQFYVEGSKAYEGKNRDRLTDKGFVAIPAKAEAVLAGITRLDLETAFPVRMGADKGAFDAHFDTGKRFQLGVGNGSADLCKGRPGTAGQAKQKKMDFFHDAVNVLPDYRGARRRTLGVLPSQALP